MRDASFILRRAGSRVLAIMLLTAAAALGGCAGGGGAANSYAMAPSAGSGATVAFESIDGPPPQVFDRMVGVLDTESKLRSLSVVSREGTAAYRVRSYRSAQIVRGKTVIAWVWDVYDANQQRALRLSGEELTAAKGGRDPWGAGGREAGLGAGLCRAITPAKPRPQGAAKPLARLRISEGKRSMPGCHCRPRPDISSPVITVLP